MSDISLEFDIKPAIEKLKAIQTEFNEAGLLKAIGLRLHQWIGDNFKTEGALVGGWKKLSPNTIASRRRGGSVVLQDTGNFKKTFDTFGQGGVRTGIGYVEVGTNSPLAPWHHHGTKPYKIFPKRGKYLKFQTTGGLVFAKIVNHPGLAARQLLPTAAQGKNLSLKLVEARIAAIRAKHG